MNSFDLNVQCDEFVPSEKDLQEMADYFDGTMKEDDREAANGELAVIADEERDERIAEELDAEFPVHDDDEDDGQPTEYEEWQDFYDGDDWDHGQYDMDCDW